MQEINSYSMTVWIYEYEVTSHSRAAHRKYICMRAVYSCIVQFEIAMAREESNRDIAVRRRRLCTQEKIVGERERIVYMREVHVGMREEAVQKRERNVWGREEDVQRRGESLREREKKLAYLWVEMCGGG